MIALKYIDKSAAAIAAIRDYRAMCVIIDSTPEEMRDIYEDIESPVAARITGMPKVKDPQSGQRAVDAAIDNLDILRARYTEAAEYMRWFEPAWKALTEDERLILSEFYMSGNQRSGAAYRLMGILNYSESHIERLRSKALSALRQMLYGG
jgi:hypothetical protein